MPDPITLSSLVAAWKLLGTLHEKYATWDVRRKTSKEAEQLKARAEELMRQINKAILGGSSSDDPHVEPLVREFKALLATGTNPSGSTMTQDWINRSRKTPSYYPSAKKAPAKRAAAKKAPAKKAAAKKAPAKKAAAKRA
jgi:hypothetical protein